MTVESDNTRSLGKGMMLIAWIMAIGLLTLVLGEWENNQQNPNQEPNSFSDHSGAEVTLKRNRMGHYLATGSINNQSAVFLLDTGATFVAIPGSLQKKYGLLAGSSHLTNTANGTARAYTTTIAVLTIGEIELRDVDASIVPNMEGDEILLGMSVLKKLEFSQSGKTMTLRQIY